MKLQVSRSVTISIGNRNFFKGQYSLEDECLSDAIDEKREELLNKIDEWLTEDREELLKVKEAMFSGFSD